MSELTPESMRRMKDWNSRFSNLKSSFDASSDKEEDLLLSPLQPRRGKPQFETGWYLVAVLLNYLSLVDILLNYLSLVAVLLNYLSLVAVLLNYLSLVAVLFIYLSLVDILFIYLSLVDIFLSIYHW